MSKMFVSSVAVHMLFGVPRGICVHMSACMLFGIYAVFIPSMVDHKLFCVGLYICSLYMLRRQ